MLDARLKGMRKTAMPRHVASTTVTHTLYGKRSFF